MSGDGQYDFESGEKAGENGAGFGAGWEDDLETMLLKGMKKKAQRRIALMGAIGAAGIMVGALWGWGVAVSTQDAAPAIQAGGGGGCVGSACKGCAAMHGGHHYEGWTVTCSGSANVDCDGCYGGQTPIGQRDRCPHGCICTVGCDHSRGWDVNDKVVGGDTLYAVHCNDAAWQGEETCSPGAATCHDSDGAATTLCLDHDDCLSNPCQNGGGCHDALQNFTCTCHPGFTGTHCEVDVDECTNGYADGQLLIQPNPCQLATPAPGVAPIGAVRCYESGGSHFYDVASASFAATPFQQPPQGYPQYVGAEGKFDDNSRFVCICASTNNTDAAYVGSGAWDTRTSFGLDCQSRADTCASNPCQNGADCVDINWGYTCTCPGGYQGLNCETEEHSTPLMPIMPGQTIDAVAAFNQDGVVGSITMSQDATDSTAATSVVVHLMGLEDGPNPWHVHSKAVTIPRDCGVNSTGGHFLEHSTDHADIWDLGAAMSLLGAEAAPDARAGEVNMTAVDLSLPLSGDQSVVGKSIVIHKKHKNARWVCATITAIVANYGVAVSCGTMSTAFAGATDDKAFSGACDGAAGDACSVHCNAGLSTGGEADYTCSATGAWEDENSDSPTVTCTDVDECASGPCVNGATCDDSISNTDLDLDVFSCSCATGFFGDLCDAATDECSSTPCVNHGTCNDGDNAYTCTCGAGFEGDNCDTDIDECASSPCQNSGTCDDSSTAQHGVEPGQFLCTCAASFHGDTCDSQTDNCASAPCLHGGTCYGSADGYTCQCADGFDGDNCNTDIDECRPAPCQNGAACTTPVPGEYYCSCPGGYLGTNCDATSNNCDSSPCQNMGVCGTTATAFSCTCSPGFTGDLCETVDPCLPTNPCLNVGTCDGSDGTPVCTCALGWHGDTCDTETDECASNPCKSCGDSCCTDGDNAYTCACDTTHTGDNCEEVADPCTPSPCQHAGVCSAGDDGAASCACPAGFFGDSCETETDECDPDPCLNSGACTDGANSFTCACTDGYGGSTCQCDSTSTVAADDTCTVCADGKTSNDDKSACQDCPPKTGGLGGVCTACTAGQKAVPPTQSTGCVACASAEAGADGSCAACGAGQLAAADHASCTQCDAGKVRPASDTDGACNVCGSGRQPNGANSECVACPLGKAGDDGTCTTCAAGKEGAPTHASSCSDCGDGTASTDGSACVTCPDGQSASDDHTGCVVASQVGQSGTCDLTHAPMCLVLNSITMTTAAHGRKWNAQAADELANGFVTDSDNVFIADLHSGPCTADGSCELGGIVVTPIAKTDDGLTFTSEIAVDSMEACHALITLFTTELADPASKLMAGSTPGPSFFNLHVNASQTPDLTCIDASAGGRR